MSAVSKGKGFEFKIQKQIKELIEDLGLNCDFHRIGMSGMLRELKGDFRWRFKFRNFKGEAKKGKQVPLTLYNWLEKDEMDFLIVARDRKPTLVVLPLENLEPFLTCQENYEEEQLEIPS